MIKTTTITEIDFTGQNPVSKKYGYEIKTPLGSGKYFGDELKCGVGSKVRFLVKKTEKAVYLNSLEVLQCVGTAPTVVKKKPWTGGAKVDTKGIEEALNNIALAILLSGAASKDLGASKALVQTKIENFKKLLNIKNN